MGMIHRSHREPGPFDLPHLKQLIREIKPDYVLTEIPPDRLDEATKQFNETGVITESRVKVFPEYVDALFPLTKEMDFKIIPCAAWTKEMNDSRRATLKKAQTTHAKEYEEMEKAQAAAGMNIARLGSNNDPVTIHTELFDQYVKQGMEPYDRHFNEMIGTGGWTNINDGHYGLIAKALDKHTGEGKTFLVTFGSWHKYYIKQELRKRSDVQLVPMSSYLQKLQPAPADWTQFRLNASGNGSYGLTEINEPVEAWKYTTGEILESSPIAVDGVIYTGGHCKRLHAIDMQSGKLKWKFDTDGWVRATPSVASGVIYFGSDDNKFYAVDTKTGQKKWDFELGEGGEQSSPAISGGVVYFGAFDNFVYALDAETGKLVWKFDAGGSMLSSPALNDDSLFIGTMAGRLFCIDRKTGKEKWSFQENDKPIFSSPVVTQDLVTFTSYDKCIYAVDVNDGKIKWKYETEGEIFSSTTVVAGTVYVGSNDKNLYALDLKTGRLHWKSDLNGAVFSSPAVTDNSIYVGSSDGHVYCLKRTDGSRHWRYKVGDDVKVWTSPIAIQGRLYFGSHAGDVICLTEKASDDK